MAGKNKISMDDSKLIQISKRVAAQEENAESSSNYGGKGTFSLPDDHVAAIQVPKGGSCCANCKFVIADEHKCSEPHYVEWNGGDPALPDLPLDEICSDWYRK